MGSSISRMLNGAVCRRYGYSIGQKRYKKPETAYTERSRVL